jgi:molybdopterin/thiamine biosynthesis adenylyltransferase
LNFITGFGQPLPDKKIAFFLLQWPDGERHGYFILPKGILKLETLAIGGPDTARTPEELQPLLNVLRVGIVGLGSLGSKVSLSLARSGVCHFVLVDGDVMQLENVCRHSSTIGEIGLMKTEAVGQALRDVSFAEPEIKNFSINLGSATNPELHARVLEELGKCHVLVDATANAEVFGLLAGLASDNQCTFIWGEVFEGGLGGYIASAHPERGPCPRCIRAGFLSEQSSWPKAPLGQTDAAYGADKDSPFIATDADVSFIASVAVNRIYDLVLRKESTLPTVMVLGLRRGWIFDSPMQIVPINIRSDDWSCNRCWHPESEPETDAVKQAEGLFSNHADNHDPSDK